MIVSVVGVIVAMSGRSWWSSGPSAAPSAIFGAVLDVRSPSISLLNPPIIEPTARAKWDPQNVRGAVVFESDGDDAVLLYPNGSRYVLSSKLYSPNGKPFIASDARTGTLTVSSGFPMNQENWKPWSVQFPTDRMRDINGDGWPEVVLADYS